MAKKPTIISIGKVLEFFLKVLQLPESLPGFTTFSGKKTELKIDSSKNWEKTEKVKLELCSVFVNLILCKVACFFKVKILSVYIKIEKWNDV